MLLHILPTLSPSWSCLECCVRVLMWPSKIFSNSYCFEIPRTFLSFLVWLVNRSLSKVSLCCQVHSFWRTFFGQRVGFVPKLSRPHCFPCKARFSLELSDKMVVRDILDVFLEVSPCFHMTMLSSSWVSWFSELLFSPRIYVGYPGLVGWAWTTTWRVERQKLYLTLSFLKGHLVSFVLK
jgi:hypothetical protein